MNLINRPTSIAKFSVLTIAIGISFLTSAVDAPIASAQVTKACTFIQIGAGATLLGQIPIDKNSQTQDEKYTATAYSVGGGGFTYFVFDSFQKSVSRVDLEYFKPKGKGNQVQITVCGRVRNNPNIPFLNFKFSNRTLKVNTLGTQKATYDITKPSHSTTVQTVFDIN